MPPQAGARQERRKERTPPVDWAGLLRRTLAVDVFACVRCGGRRRVLAYVKQARGVRDFGAPGTAHGRCEPDPGASATPGRMVLRLTPPQPRDLVPLPRPSWEGRSGQACPRRLRGLSTGPAHSSAGTRQRPSSASLHQSSPLNTATLLPIRQRIGSKLGPTRTDLVPQDAPRLLVRSGFDSRRRATSIGGGGNRTRRLALPEGAWRSLVGAWR